jgi:hypothetical protein
MLRWSSFGYRHGWMSEATAGPASDGPLEGCPPGLSTPLDPLPKFAVWGLDRQPRALDRTDYPCPAGEFACGPAAYPLVDGRKMIDPIDADRWWASVQVYPAAT